MARGICGVEERGRVCRGVSQLVACARDPIVSVVFDPILSVLQRLKAADVLNAAAYPLNEDPPTVPDLRRNGL
jgi:hypothetical protein